MKTSYKAVYLKGKKFLRLCPTTRLFKTFHHFGREQCRKVADIPAQVKHIREQKKRNIFSQYPKISQAKILKLVSLKNTETC